MNHMAATYITERMKPARVAKGLTVKEIALLIGRGAGHVGNAERGAQPLKIEYAARVAQILDIPLEELITDTPRKPRKDRAAA